MYQLHSNNLPLINKLPMATRHYYLSDSVTFCKKQNKTKNKKAHWTCITKGDKADIILNELLIGMKFQE